MQEANEKYNNNEWPLENLADRLRQDPLELCDVLLDVYSEYRMGIPGQNSTTPKALNLLSSEDGATRDTVAGVIDRLKQIAGDEDGLKIAKAVCAHVDGILKAKSPSSPDVGG